MQAYGRTTYLITSLERVPRGTEGAVSLEGTLAGLAAAAFTAGIAIPLHQVTVMLLLQLLGAKPTGVASPLNMACKARHEHCRP
jgi:uncharacterized membrane protein